ncbi:MAG TPA: universal stress protein, partial [Cyclobacteriaceae bacterium]
SAAESAANYAAWLAQKLSAKVELVHVLGINTSENSLHNWKTLENRMITSAEEGAARLMETIRNPVEITFKHLKGSPFEEVISEYASKSKVDMVVIGSRGASGVKRALFGSNAAKLVDACPRPVVVVPAEFEFDGMKKILYATDMVHLDEEIKTVVRLAKPFDAGIVILHITDEDARKRDRSNLKEILSRIADYKKIDFMIIGKDDVVAGIEEAISATKPDLLAMFTHQRDIKDKIFGRGVTRQLAFLNHLPLMVINRTTSRQ